MSTIHPAAADRIEGEEVLDLLASLVQKSLAVYEEDEQGQGRYHLLETVRQYGRDRLLEGDEANAVRERHRDWFLTLAERAEPNLLFGAEQVAWLDRLETEHGNLRAALEWCQETTEGAEAGLRLAAALTWFWIRRGYLAEAWHWFDEALAGDAGASAAARGAGIAGAMWAAWFRWDNTSVASLAAEGLVLGRAAGDKRLTALSFLHSGAAAMRQSKREQAQALYEEGLAVARQLDDKWLIASFLGALGSLAEARGNDEQARVHHSESLSLYRELEDTGAWSMTSGWPPSAPHWVRRPSRRRGPRGGR